MTLLEKIKILSEMYDRLLRLNKIHQDDVRSTKNLLDSIEKG